MAAMRSALMSLCRRSCNNSGSAATAFASVAGRGVDIGQAIVSTAPRTTLLPSSRPAAIRNIELQGLRRFSTSGMECPDQKMPLLMKHKAENVLRLWWQRSKDHVKNYRSTSSDGPYAKDCRSIHVFGTIGCLALLTYVVVIIRAMHLHNVGTASQCATYSTYPNFLLPGYRCVHFYPFDDNFVSKERTDYIDEE